MSIKETISSEGVKVFRVNIDVRSKVNPSIRIQKQKELIETFSEAKKVERLLIREAEREMANRETADATWEEVIEAFHLSMRARIRLNNASIDISTLDDYVAVLYKRTANWMKNPASSILTSDVRHLIETMKLAGSSQSHQSGVKGIINKVFVFGLETRLIRKVDRSPTVGISVSRKGEKVPDILTGAQLQSVMKHAMEYEPDWYHIWALAIYTGMRNGELMSLLWSDIDWNNKLIHVTKSYNSRTKIVKSTKSGDWRDIPISSDLERLLKELMLKTGHSLYVLPQPWQWKQGQQAEILRKFCLQVGLPSIRFHALRACFATQLLKNSIAPVTVMKICGWKDLKTMQHYIRLSGIEIAGATEVLRFLSPREAIEEVGKNLEAEVEVPESCLTEAVRV